VGIRVAEVRRDGVAVGNEDRGQSPIDFRERLAELAVAKLPSACRISVVRIRAGPSCSSFIATPLGHKKPWLTTSSGSPRMAVTSSSSSVIVSPHVASHNGQVRKRGTSRSGHETHLTSRRRFAPGS
jgi:hypothetical protein